MRDFISTNKRARGAAAVGRIADLSPIEVASVLYFRMWNDGQNGLAQIKRDFISTLGSDDGQTAFWAFDNLCQHCSHYSRRPLMRHQLKCNCLCADESCFANLIQAAGEGEREDAALMASLIIRPDLALPMADLAQQVAISFQRLINAVPDENIRSQTLH